jgi:hypothetical protein
MIEDATKFLIATFTNTASSDAGVRAASQSFFDTLGHSSIEDRNEALRAFSEHLDLNDGARAEQLALICGMLVERGSDPSPLEAPLMEQLRPALALSAEFAEACVAQMPSAQEGERSRNEVFEESADRLAATMPRHYEAWNDLSRFWRPAIAVFSVSPGARTRANPLRESAKKIAAYHEAGGWLDSILAVLVDEPIVVIEPGSSRGILGRITGIADNFQLNTLLMDAFPRSGIFSRRRVSRRAAAIARGDGPQASQETMVSPWNLYTWEAIQPDLTLPSSDNWRSATAYWIWNEGAPEDIPKLNGQRVVLLGPASYPRGFFAQRSFKRLRARLDCEQVLSKAEVNRRLQQMVAAKGAT